MTGPVGQEAVEAIPSGLQTPEAVRALQILQAEGIREEAVLSSLLIQIRLLLQHRLAGA
jgi:hypothetical protein